MSGEWIFGINQLSIKKGAAYLGAAFTIKTSLWRPCGALNGIDPVSGQIKWTYKNKAPLWGGVLSTAGGIVITGTPEGKLLAFDDATGKFYIHSM